MKHRTLYLSMLLIVLLTACAPVHDDIFTTVSITLSAADGMQITGVQAQVKLTNVNTRQVTTAANFEGAAVEVEILRGAYQIDVEGVAAITADDGTTRYRQFRCQSDYAEFVAPDANKITLPLIFLDRL